MWGVVEGLDGGVGTQWRGGRWKSGVVWKVLYVELAENGNGAVSGWRGATQSGRGAG